MKQSLIFFISFLHFFNVSCAQNIRRIDSLNMLLKTTIHDTTRINTLYQLSVENWGVNLNSAMKYAQRTLELSKKVHYKKGIGKAFNSMAVINESKGEYARALELYQMSLKIRIEIGDKIGMAGSYGNMGNIYTYQGNYIEALKNHFASLKINEEIGEKEGMGACYNNIGTIYYNLNKYSDALNNYLLALKFAKESGNKGLEAGILLNIEDIYYKQGKAKEAINTILEALKIYKEEGDNFGIANSYNNLGVIYKEQRNFPKAIEYFLAALKINKKLEDKDGIIHSYHNIGEVYIGQKKYIQAAKYLEKAFSISIELGRADALLSSYYALATLDSSKGNYRSALHYYLLYFALHDSLVNKENFDKTAQLQLLYDFDKRQAKTKVLQEKRNLIAFEELRKQKLIRNIFGGGFAIIFLFAGVFLRQRRRIWKEKQTSDIERKRSDDLLLNILPLEIAEELKVYGKSKAKAHTQVTVMFTDFEGFSKISERISAELLVDEIHYCFSGFDSILDKYKIEKIKTIGDAYMCASGLLVSNHTHAVDMINAALEIRDFINSRKNEKVMKGEIPFEIRIGIHSGPVVSGIVGVRKYAYDIWGDTVNIAERMESNSKVGKINISGSTYTLVKNNFKSEYRGKIEAKNKGMIDMYFVEHS